MHLKGGTYMAVDGLDFKMALVGPFLSSCAWLGLETVLSCRASISSTLRFFTVWMGNS